MSLCYERAGVATRCRYQTWSELVSPEGELTGCPGRGGAGRDGEGLRGAGGGGGDGAVAPAVGHHAAVSVGGGGAPENISVQ